MVAVVHEVDGAQTFNDGWWKGDLYFDEEKAFYKALGGGDLQWRSPLRLLTPTGLKTITSSFLNVSGTSVMGRKYGYMSMNHSYWVDRENVVISKERVELWEVSMSSTKEIKV